MRQIFHGGRPRVAPFFPNRQRWGGERRIGEGPDRDPVSCGAGLAGPTHRGYAGRTEIVVDPGAGVTRAGIDLVRTVEPNVLARKIRGAAPGHARAALAVLTMTHINHDRLGRDDDAKVATQSSGGSRHMLVPLTAGPVQHNPQSPTPMIRQNDESLHRMRRSERSLLLRSVSPRFRLAEFMVRGGCDVCVHALP